MLLLYAMSIGLSLGAICWFILPQRKSAGLITNLLTGIVGAVAASFMGEASGLYPPTLKSGLIIAFMGALLLIISNKLLSSGKYTYDDFKKSRS